MWCEILQRKISSPKAIIHAYSPKCIRFSKFLPHTTSALRAPSPQGEGFDLCRSVKQRNKSKCIRVTKVQTDRQIGIWFATETGVEMCANGLKFLWFLCIMILYATLFCFGRYGYEEKDPGVGGLSGKLLFGFR